MQFSPAEHEACYIRGRVKMLQPPLHPPPKVCQPSAECLRLMFLSPFCLSLRTSQSPSEQSGESDILRQASRPSYLGRGWRWGQPVAAAT